MTSSEGKPRLLETHLEKCDKTDLSYEKLIWQCSINIVLMCLRLIVWISNIVTVNIVYGGCLELCSKGRRKLSSVYILLSALEWRLGSWETLKGFSQGKTSSLEQKSNGFDIWQPAFVASLLASWPSAHHAHNLKYFIICLWRARPCAHVHHMCGGACVSVCMRVSHVLCAWCLQRLEEGFVIHGPHYI